MRLHLTLVNVLFSYFLLLSADDGLEAYSQNVDLRKNQRGGYYGMLLRRLNELCAGLVGERINGNENGNGNE